MLKVILPDGNVLEFSHAVRPIDVAAKIGPRLAKATLAAEVDGQLVGADVPLPAEGQVRLRLLTAKDPEALDILRHSCRPRDGPGGDAALRGGATGLRPHRR